MGVSVTVKSLKERDSLWAFSEWNMNKEEWIHHIGGFSVFIYFKDCNITFTNFIWSAKYYTNLFHEVFRM